jgi:hypothetical protein
MSGTGQAPTLYVVHCVDTEGPLEETLQATFQRLKDRFGLEMPPSLSLLNRLQQGMLDLAGREEEVAAFLAPRRLDYLSLWGEVEASVAAVTDPDFRRSHCDGAGGGYRFSWFITDVVGYCANPRRKAEGFHAIWDQYRLFLHESAPEDVLGWHFHAVTPDGQPLEYNTSWTSNDWPERVLARRIIERGHFPGLFRAGGNVMRNDLSHWLERFIPLDFSSCSRPDGGGRPGSQEDWRGAPTEWGAYHPDFRDYRRPGGMQRWVFRTMPIENRCGYLQPDEVEDAFAQAADRGSAVLSLSNHDRRELRPDVEYVHELVRRTAERFPEVQWRYANAQQAAAAHLDLAPTGPPGLKLSLKDGLLWIESDRRLFGEPFLALEQQGGLFFRDNPTQEGPLTWAYRPRRPREIRAMGVGACTPDGRSAAVAISGAF